MYMLEEICAKRDETYAIARKHKAEKLCDLGSCTSMEERLGSEGKRMVPGTAYLSNIGNYSSFAYGDDVIRFMTSPRLVRYAKVTNWDNGYIEVVARYGDRDEEEYIDLVPILENLCIEPTEFLKPIKNVEVSYA